ncbi:MAG: hypothetical protein ACI8UO_001473 [Verrucomicrobiales bacterium]|jgi:hypothetical protein
MKILLFSLLLAGSAIAADAELKPLMGVPGEVVLENDFGKAGKPAKENWQPRQATRWTIEDGVLRGIPSTPENQAAKTHHRGLEARASVPKTPAEFVAQFSIRFLEGEENAIVPFVEFGHHICRIKFSADDGVFIIADHEMVRVAEARAFKYEPGKWYHALAELKGDEFVIQFADGPTLYARHESFAKPTPSGGNGFGVAGPRGGSLEIDDVRIWNIGEAPQAGWAKTRAAFPVFKHVPTEKASKPPKK